jgi:hypothetical protein
MSDDEWGDFEEAPSVPPATDQGGALPQPSTQQGPGVSDDDDPFGAPGVAALGGDGGSGPALPVAAALPLPLTPPAQQPHPQAHPATARDAGSPTTAASAGSSGPPAVVDNDDDSGFDDEPQVAADLATDAVVAGHDGGSGGGGGRSDAVGQELVEPPSPVPTVDTGDAGGGAAPEGASASTGAPSPHTSGATGAWLGSPVDVTLAGPSSDSSAGTPVAGAFPPPAL